MKKGILCILLAITMVVPLLTACQNEADLTKDAAKVFTFYTIKDDETSDDAVREVELALNRILFHRLGVILDLVMVNEDEYDALIDEKFAEMEKYEEEKKNNKKNNKNNKNNKNDSSDDSSNANKLTGDDILELLENGQDIPSTTPSLDIFLVRGYDEYYELASNNKLTAIDDTLSNEAKALNQYIHTTIFGAAKVNNKTYGVPVNSAIGEYTYFVYDTELLEKHKIDPKTIKNLEDLESYLELIKNDVDNPDVVPLKNVAASTDVSFLGQDGFPALVEKGFVVDAYSNKTLLNYFSTIARYNMLGYFGDSADITDETEESEDTTRYAVRIETGNIDTLNKTLPETTQGYTYSTYSAPIATNETAFENIFCLSKYVVAQNIVDVMEILAAINTDPQLMNLLTYGVEKTHYELDDAGQVKRLNSAHPYLVNPNYIGNCFITYTLQDENPLKWDNDIKQNNEAIVSPALGFTQSFTKFEYELDGEKNTIYEPDYIAIINDVVDEYYAKLMDGTALNIPAIVQKHYPSAEGEVIENHLDYFVNKLEEEIMAVEEADLETIYISNKIEPQLKRELENSVISEKGQALLKQAQDEVEADVRAECLKTVKQNLKGKFEQENPDASSEDINKMVDNALKDTDYIDELVDEQFALFDTELYQEYVDVYYNDAITSAISEKIDSMKETSQYKQLVADAKNSEEFLNDLANIRQFDVPDKIKAKINEIFSAEIQIYAEAMFADINTAIEAEVEAFITEYSETLGLSRNAILKTIGFVGQPEEGTESDDNTDTSTDTSTDDTSSDESNTETEGEESTGDVALYDSWFEFVFEAKLQKPYYSIFGDPAKAA